MSQELTQTVLSSLKGRLDITVTVPHIAGKLVVWGISTNARDFGWEGMPEEMKVDRAVYSCKPAWDESAPRVFVFADDVEVVDAPAHMVVDQMIDMMYDKGLDRAVERLEGYSEPDEWDEEED